MVFDQLGGAMPISMHRWKEALCFIITLSLLL